jgi:hypothetical protein
VQDLHHCGCLLLIQRKMPAKPAGILSNATLRTALLVLLINLSARVGLLIGLLLFAPLLILAFALLLLALLLLALLLLTLLL